jgi:Bacterial mobilisation protein (MobC)
MASGSEKRQRTAQLKIRLSASELDALQKLADSAGLSVAGFVRSVSLGTQPPKQSRKPLPEARELSRIYGQIGHIGGNINQLAKIANLGGWPSVDEINEVRQQVLWMRQILMKAFGGSDA